MIPIWISIICTILALIIGFFAGKINRKYDERARLQKMEKEERVRQDNEIYRLSQAEERRVAQEERDKTARRTREALDFGYTMQQILDWAYHEVYFNDFEPEQIKRVRHPTSGRVRDETQEEATNRRMQARYTFLKRVFLGQESLSALDGRNIKEALLAAGIETSTMVYRRISEEGVVEDLEKRGINHSQVIKVADVISQAKKEEPSAEELLMGGYEKGYDTF